MTGTLTGPPDGGRQRSQAALLREALDALVHGDEIARRAARARCAFGAFRSGTADTSDRHDEVLAEAYGR